MPPEGGSAYTAKLSVKTKQIFYKDEASKSVMALCAKVFHGGLMHAGNSR